MKVQSTTDESSKVQRFLEIVREKSLDPEHVCRVLSPFIELIETSELDETLSVRMVTVALKTQWGVDSDSLPCTLAGWKTLQDSLKSM